MAEPVTFRLIDLSELRFSGTQAQVERRKHFDKTALGELAESILSVGLQQPIVIRHVNGHYEVVAGERRAIAAKQAGLEAIEAVVRDLSDEQVLEVQLIENLQREGLHELVEAEGYESLIKQHRFTIDQLVDKVGKSKAYIYARLKLTALCPEARKAFFDDKLNASTALLIARIPVHDLQRKACKEITAPRWGGGPMSYRQAAEHVHREYMLQLSQAPFPTGDPDLVPKAGPCGSCPKRTGNQKELFGDVKSADVCTDPVCFAAKRDANAARLAAAAEASGKEVITGAAAKKIAPHGVDRSYGPPDLNGYLTLDEQKYIGGKYQTIRAAIGKDVEPKYLQSAETGKLIPIVSEAVLKAALQKRGLKIGSAYERSSTQGAQEAAKARKRRIELEFRRRLYGEIRAKHPAKAGRAELEAVARAYWDRLWHETAKNVLKLWDAEPEKRRGGYGLDAKGPLARRIPEMTDAELVRFLLDMAYAHELDVPTYSDDAARGLLAAAKRLRINPEKIRRQLAAELAPKTKAKKNAIKSKVRKS